jgi:hypothetical protein
MVAMHQPYVTTAELGGLMHTYLAYGRHTAGKQTQIMQLGQFTQPQLSADRL